MAKHKFDPKHMSSLEDPKRLEYEDPEHILSAFCVQRVGRAIDIGAGTGFYTRPLCRRLGPGGFIWACDVSRDVLQWLQGSLSADERQRIGLVRIGESALPFAANTMNLMIMANVLHEFDHPDTMMQEAYRILRAEGRVLVVDWKKEAAPFGPPYAHRVSLQDMEGLLEEAGFTRIQPPHVLKRHNALLAGKPGNVR
ncbi:class I SAM-dependent methyltransferase [Desulfovermiculus halophilus]|jgi:ubiquinone/menaquinone biosynthesis C-methylase UbiE|uniref:class I SAM-dependent methyltransferase n=1 Tax=Desulfovermiculus halophilus TaxID=339722 RepID=UPI00047FD06C|nr:class I SAM-dependent methyltransferase [Desulfovermiculus halophilus]